MSSKIEQFLREHLDHDEQEIRRRWNRDGVTSEKFHGTPFDPARVLAEVAAKRRLVEALLGEGHASLRPGGSTEVYCGADYGAGDPCDCGRDERVSRFLCILAAVYADHPGYREEWRP